jgi:hypothetical protein
MNTASAPNSTALLITTSMSNSRYRRIDAPIAIGIRMNVRTATFWRTVSHPAWSGPPHSEFEDRIITTENTLATITAAVTSQRSWSRSIPVDRRKRRTRPSIEPRIPIGIARMTEAANPSGGASASIPRGFGSSASVAFSIGPGVNKLAK